MQWYVSDGKTMIYAVHNYCQGLIVIINSVPCLDINECTEGTDSCVQNCTNIDGSYMCNCTTGYRLSNDGFSCNGTASVYILVTYLIPLIISFWFHRYQ